jgi:hypothetical protein
MTILTKEQWETSVAEAWSASIKATYQNLIDEAVKAEREACAEICKKHADFYAGLEPSPIAQSAWAACVDNRDTIRARGQA